MDALKKGQSSGSHIGHSIWFDYVENQCSFCKTKGGGGCLIVATNGASVLMLEKC